MKLAYWPIRGLVQPAKLILKYAQVDFEDKQYGADWPEEKFTLGLDFPNLPYLIDGDVKLTQSAAIYKYLGNKFGLVPKTEEETIKCDMLMFQIIDLRSQFTDTSYSKDDVFVTKKENFLTKTIPNHLKMLDAFFNGKQFVAGHITYVDFMIYEILDCVFAFDKTYNESKAFNEFKNLAAFHANFEALPTLAEYIKEVHAKAIPMNGSSASFK